ncbi:hypothetical protein WJX72_001093 [[Myrmecia] bisecta]|uniref:PRA1 family protein n=1 Tax=[Myrmecia] bisecta TaxID=41462 RepID=A0AAW1Q380_9CHLO
MTPSQPVSATAYYGLYARAPGTAGRKICGVQRSIVVVGLLLLGGLLVVRARALLTLAWAVLFGDGLILLHAAFRTPNLKTRLASAREEFRAVWRGYQTSGFERGDYTL